MSYNDPLCTFVFAPKIHASKIQQVEAIGQELKSVIKTNYPPEVLQLAPEKLPKPKRKVISQPSFFRGYVKLRGVYVSSDERIKILGKQIQAYVRDPEHHGRNMDSSGGSRSARILHTMLSLKWSDDVDEWGRRTFLKGSPGASKEKAKARRERRATTLITSLHGSFKKNIKSKLIRQC